MPKQQRLRCPSCGYTTCRCALKSKAIGITKPNPRKSKVVSYTNPYKGMTFTQRRPVYTARLIRPVMTGRSGSAPLITNLTAILAAGTAQGVTYVRALSDLRWATAAPGSIRLAYALLDGTTVPPSGLISRPGVIDVTDATLLAHFDAIAAKMAQPRTRTDETECTGEAAAALGVSTLYPGYRMIWGFSAHAGAGIDQIWSRTVHGHVTDYLIVEAKGVGQTLSSSFPGTAPSNVGTQMSRGWVLDRLGRMQTGSTPARAVSRAIQTNVGLTRTVPTGWAGFGGASKTYYSATHSPPANNAATMHGVVIAAHWNGVQLGYIAQTAVQYY